ncbi:alpha/beta fold hydrolase [Pseudooceanicola onchidii]|uniref:alpha/beta fold hydrolase n=1 Tax=Pseudooceanicola onchidii TaxID=2562279 RepID=UPI0010A9CB45|nr:alpha/beta hydrolase [Pseudooceanicola onchidii]
MRERTIQLNGQDFHLREWGEETAPVLLMLHGFPEYGRAWEGLAGRLGDRYRCIAPDQRGYGQSYAPQEVEAYKLAELVGDMVALIDQIGGPVTVVGHDWGSAVAYGLAMARPDLVDRLVILNGVHPGPFQRALAMGGKQTEASQYMTFLRRDDAEDRLSANGYDKLRRLFAEDMDMSWMTEDLAQDYLTEWSRPGRLTGMLNWYRATSLVVPKTGERAEVRPFPTDKFRVRMPHLLIWGLGDTALLPSSTKGLETYCDALTRVEMDQADHWIVHQRPDEVAQIIRGWLATAP